MKYIITLLKRVAGTHGPRHFGGIGVPIPQGKSVAGPFLGLGAIGSRCRCTRRFAEEGPAKGHGILLRGCSEEERATTSGPWSALLPGHRRFASRLLDSLSNAGIGAAAANVSLQCLVDVGVGGRWYLREQRSGGHDLAGLAVAALYDLQVEPGLLNQLAGGGGATPSIVVIECPAAVSTGVTQERLGMPSRCTVHAP